MTKFACLLVCIAHLAVAQTKDVNFYWTESKRFSTEKDYPQALAMMMEANKLHPYHQGVLYQLGVLSALNNKPEESIKNLSKAIRINSGYKLADNADLASLKDRSDFRDLLELQKKLTETQIHSDTAFTVKDRTLHIESVTHDPRTGSFYLGSLHQRKIVKVDKAGVAKDFTTSAQDGLTAVFGVRVDPKGKFLWACSSPVEEMMNYDSTAQSAVSQYDLKTGKLLKQYRPTAKTHHLFGDLTINSVGDVFVSDSKNNAIFKVNQISGSLDLYFDSEEFWNIQGITFSTDNRYLFISDYIKGPFRLDMQTRQLVKLTSSIESSLKGIDGMVFYNGSLVVLQNGTYPLRATKYLLNPGMDAVTNATIIDQAHPAMNEPTIGTIDNDVFYYVANSQWGGYDDNHKIKAASELQDIVVLKFRLH